MPHEVNMWDTIISYALGTALLGLGAAAAAALLYFFIRLVKP